MTTMRNGLIGFVVLLAATAAHGEEAKGESLKAALGELATKVKAVAANLSQTSVSIGEFTGSQDARRIGVGGGSIMSELELFLGKFVNPDAELELSGQLALIDDPKDTQLKVLKFNAVLKDKKLDTVAEFKEFTAFIRNATDFARITGATVAFKPDGDYKDTTPSEGRRLDVQNSLPPKAKEPPKVTAFVKGSVVRSSEAGKYDVEIQAGKSADGAFHPLSATLTDATFPGVPVVEIEKDTFYRVRVKNNDAGEIAVFLHLDGIDQFTFSQNRGTDGRPEYRCWVVEPGREVVVKGWHKNVSPGEVFGFLTTQAGKGAASKFPTLSKGKVGTICVGIAHTKPEGSKGPGLETAVGPPIQVEQKPVTRVIAEPHEFITVRYSR